MFFLIKCQSFNLNIFINIRMQLFLIYFYFLKNLFAIIYCTQLNLCPWRKCLKSSLIKICFI
uniref:Uncharacterized protein n=1 Tax=Phlebia radiata TaxID=5308 RepID=L8B9C6_PHLRA|nr:hypothetical protein PRA_mt0064 [Phlebia radiata]YP_007374976.1 hypothetical protein PRA_mt0194 [Phlebia radiata]CCE89185.1 hypothetical protein PRA_mt0064 [Phlebia radiata]CCE89254.1 hypothetical protein PRA_mt0194 [Phlebia radiata]